MPGYLNLEQWHRKNHFHFFLNFEDPFFNICAEVEVSPLLAYAEEHGVSFFIAYLYLALKTANLIEEFRYRIRGERVLIHDVIHAGSTVLHADQTFGFCYFDYHPAFVKFHEDASARLQQHGDEKLEPHDERDDLIHCSVIPWVSFTSFAHAQRLKTQSSVPKIVFGKYHQVANAITMPVSVEVHHALMDGLHVGKFFELLQKFLLDPRESLASK